MDARTICQLLITIPVDSITPDQITSLVTACRAALGDPTVAEAFNVAVSRMNGSGGSNKVPCVAAGVTETIVAGMSAYGADNKAVAEKGCEALGSLTGYGNAGYADALVLSTGGLEAVYSVMLSQADSEQVQSIGCWALGAIAYNTGPAALSAMREGPALTLLNAAKKNFPGSDGVKIRAESAIESLTAKRKERRSFTDNHDGESLASLP